MDHNIVYVLLSIIIILGFVIIDASTCRRETFKGTPNTSSFQMGDTLLVNQPLIPLLGNPINPGVNCIMNSLGSAFLLMHDSGNLVLYEADYSKKGWSGRALWSTGTSGNGMNAFAVLRQDGNLVVQTGTVGRPIDTVWSSGTAGGPTQRFVMLDCDNVLSIVSGTPLEPRDVLFTTDPARMMPGLRGTVFDSTNFDDYIGTWLSEEFGLFYVSARDDGSFIAVQDSNPTPVTLYRTVYNRTLSQAAYRPITFYRVQDQLYINNEFGKPPFAASKVSTDIPFCVSK